MAPSTYVEPLKQAAERLKPKNVLEIGIGYDAFSTQVWLGHTEAYVTTVDKRDWGDKAKALASIRFAFIEERSEIALPKLKSKYDLIYIDGDHAYEGCRADILNCQKLLADGGIIIMDDYGVTATNTALDIDDNGNVIDGPFGVKQAVDECFGPGWEEALKDIKFANGGKAFKRA